MSEPADFLALEGQLIERIRERLPDLKAVMRADELATVQQNAQHAPAAHVLFTGYTPINVQRDDVVQIGQTWTVVLVTRTVRRHPDEHRGHLSARLIAALHGWKPSAARTALSLTNSPIPPSYGPGVAYLPVAFDTSVITRTGD